jgi:hypothetical protein
MDGYQSIQKREGDEAGHQHQLWPVVAMADSMSSLESFGSTFSDHNSLCHQHKSKEEVNPNSSRRFRSAMTTQRENAAWGGTVVPLPAAVSSNPAIQSTKTQKKSIGRERRR